MFRDHGDRTGSVNRAAIAKVLPAREGRGFVPTSPITPERGSASLTSAVTRKNGSSSVHVRFSGLQAFMVGDVSQSGVGITDLVQPVLNHKKEISAHEQGGQQKAELKHPEPERQAELAAGDNHGSEADNGKSERRRQQSQTGASGQENPETEADTSTSDSGRGGRGRGNRPPIDGEAGRNGSGGEEHGKGEDHEDSQSESGREGGQERTFSPHDRGLIRPASEAEQAAIRRHLQETRGTVRMNDPRIGAIHGTSLEAMEHLATDLVLPGRQTTELHYRKGDISVVPTNQLRLRPESNHLISAEAVDYLGRSPEDLLELAKEYAGIISFDHAVLRMLGIPIERRSDFSDELTELKAGDPIPFEQRGIPSERIREAQIAARRRKGFVLGIAAESLGTADLPLIPGDRGAPDLAIGTMGRGLPANVIRVVQPLGYMEENFLENL